LALFTASGCIPHRVKSLQPATMQTMVPPAAVAGLSAVVRISST
jgi:hypothetical protein